MATINSNDLRVTNANNLVGLLADEADSGLSYLFIGKPTVWSSGDESPPTPNNSVDEFRAVYDQMLALKKISTGEVAQMTSRINWTSGTLFDIYRHDYSSTNTSVSGASNLIDAKWIILNQNNDVYICLDNNNNQASTIEPLNQGNVPFHTSDGYQWLRVYSIPSATLETTSTTDLIPVVDNETVTTTDGSVYTAIIGSGGSNYTSSPAGVVNQIPYYYCNVNGDGNGAVARVTVSSSGSITDIELVRFGSGYTYAQVDFRAGYVYQSLADLDGVVNALDPLGDGTFSSTVIIGPRSGWGTDVIRELCAVKIGIFTDIQYNQQDFLEGVSFRQIGLLRGVEEDPSLSNPTTMNATYAVKLVTQNAGSPIYEPGEKIYQTVDVDGGTYKAWGTVVSWSGDDEISGILTYIQDPRTAVDEGGGLYEFQGSNYIIGETSGKVGEVQDFDLAEDDRLFQNGYSRPEVQKYTGTMTQLSNISPVLRSTTQTEKVSIIISY